MTHGRDGIVNPLEDLLGYQLRRASAAMLADLASAIEPLSLRPTEISVLMLIEANPGITQSEIGRLLGIQRANMAPIAGGLVQRGLIERLPVDGRSHGLALSEAGRALVDRARPLIDRQERAMLPGLDDAERARLTALLRSIRGGD